MIIGISGKLGCGKTTVANFLVNSMLPFVNEKGVKMSFAGKLKKMAAQIYGFDESLCYFDKNAKIRLSDDLNPELVNPAWNGEATVREILQYYGTDYARAKSQNYWVDELAKDVEKEDGKFVVIDDVRFPNEYDFTMQNGLCIRIDAYPGYKGSGNHLSETALDNHDFSMRFAPSYGMDYLHDVAIKVCNRLCELGYIKSNPSMIF